MLTKKMYFINPFTEKFFSFTCETYTQLLMERCQSETPEAVRGFCALLKDTSAVLRRRTGVHPATSQQSVHRLVRSGC